MTFDAYINRALRDRASLSVVSEELLTQDEPFIFRGDTPAFNEFLDYFSTRLGVDRSGIFIVGSGRLGFSLNPRHPGTAFKEPSDDPESDESASDIDVAICDERLFDECWRNLLSWRYPWHVSHWQIGHKEWGGRILENCFAGHIQPHEIRYIPVGRKEYRDRLLQLSELWFSTFKSTSLIASLGKYEYKGRLYRTREHAVRYHQEGLRYLLHKMGRI